MGKVFPLRELMIICSGCGGERMVPSEVLAGIHSTADFKRFTDNDLAEYACRCGAGTCDLRLLPCEPPDQP